MVSLILRVLILVLIILSIAGLQWVRASDQLAVVFLVDVSDSVDTAAREQALAFVRSALAEMEPDDRAGLVVFGANALVERPLSQAGELASYSVITEYGAHAPYALFSIPTTVRTDIGEAIRLGLALLPATAQRRLVLLSDGQGNVPGGEAAAALAAASGVELDTVPLAGRGGHDAFAEAWVDALDVPSALYEGEEFGLVVRVQSVVEQWALLRLFAPDPEGTGDRLVVEETVPLRKGLNSFLFTLPAGKPGFSTFTAQLVPEQDTFYQNNVLGAFAVVRGAPRVLIVAQSEYPDRATGQAVDDAARLALALEQAGLRVERATPADLPPDLASAGDYSAVVLVNVPATALSPADARAVYARLNSRQMAMLQAYVRDLGRGLVCVGGEESYGVGGYFRTPLEETLPVEMTIKDKTRMPPLAIVFVIDRSGSMDIAARQGGARKIDLAKEAIIRSLELLQPGDQVGVVAFESTAQWVFPSLEEQPPLGGARPGKQKFLPELTDVAAVQQQVGTIRAGGGTDIYSGLSAAVAAMENSDASVKHVILLTDGGASQEGLWDLVTRLRATDGTLSTIGVGQDAASFLQPLAVDGGGQYHHTDNPAAIPQIFAQETTLAQRAYIVEDTFYPALAGRSAILQGIEAVPALHGYVATSIKPAAQMILASNQQDPVLAQWQYGLGRAVAWTSDAKGKWAREWVRWDQFPRFWAQAVRWTIVERDDSGLETQIIDEGERVHVVVDVMEAEGRYANDMSTTVHLFPASIGRQVDAAQGSPEGSPRGAWTVRLRQTAPGRYEGDLLPGGEVYRERGADTGRGAVYLLRVVAEPPDASSEGSPEGSPRGAQPLIQVTGYVRPYSREYRSFGTDEAALHRLAEIGRGRVFQVTDADRDHPFADKDHPFAADPASVFAHDQDAVRTYTPVWPWLLGLAVCLLPLDVGVRRVAVDWMDVRRATAKVRAWIRAHKNAGKRVVFRRRPTRVQSSERAARLMAAKKRATERAAVQRAIKLDTLDSKRGISVEGPAGTAGPAADDWSVEETHVPPAPSAAAFEEPEQAPAPELGPEDDGQRTMTARLLAAKRRARRGSAGSEER